MDNKQEISVDSLLEPSYKVRYDIEKVIDEGFPEQDHSICNYSLSFKETIATCNVCGQILKIKRKTH